MEEKNTLGKSKKSAHISEKQRLRNAELLLEVSRCMSTMSSLEGMLRILIEMAIKELDAERGTLFLNDPVTNELYSRVMQGNCSQELRFANNIGIAGFVFQHKYGLIVDNPYEDPRFNNTIDEQTGFVTHSILVVPIKTAKGEVFGVAQALNKRHGKFSQNDLTVFETMAAQGVMVLQGAIFIEHLEKIRRQEREFINIVSEMTSDINITSLLQKVMGEATRMLDAERSTLFLNDEKTNELWSEVGQGLESMQLRMPNHLGIAGSVFTTGKSINIPYAYADLRFNPTFDKKTGFFTRSILCVPVINKRGKIIGVTQILNKRGGPFNNEDEAHLQAFTAQVSIALENAQLFAEVQAMKNYNEAMLQSMSNAVITLDECGTIITCNAAGLRIFNVTADQILKKSATDFLGSSNPWMMEKLALVEKTGEQLVFMDGLLNVGQDKLSVNLTLQRLFNMKQKSIGSMIVIEDISSEKRIKATMARYMDPAIAEQLIAAGNEVLGGKNVECTVLFSDVRGFTTFTERLGAQGTVTLLNEYFSLMVDCIQHEGGMLDKFIGDAIMAVFGIPLAHKDDPDRAMRTAIAMIKTLKTWNQERIRENKIPVRIGIGLNTDSVVSGNIGSQKRMDFTVIGDGVNLAARLESACKQYGASILISEFTLAALQGNYRIREVDVAIVKGKTKPIGLYEVLDYHDEESFPMMGKTLILYQEGLEMYRKRQWDKAIELFEATLNINPHDVPSKLYIKRAHHLKENPPPEDWTGVWTLESK